MTTVIKLYDFEEQRWMFGMSNGIYPQQNLSNPAHLFAGID